MNSPIILILHLLCATLFIGVVAFEVLILEGIRPMLSAETMAQVEKGIHTRGRKIMPPVVITLFITGAMMGISYLNSMSWQPFDSSFGTLLIIKIILALSVLVHFITAITHSICDNMISRRFKYTHLSVFIHMLLIIVLAKGMFYFNF